MGIAERKFGILPNGETVKAFTLENTAGVRLTVLSFGARLQSLQVPDKRGTLGEVVLGHDTLAPYLEPSDFHGAVVGRYANRIAGGQLTLESGTYPLPCNEPHACLHGGNIGFAHRNWRLKRCENDDDAPSVTLAYTSADLEEGFPGQCEVTVTYCLTTDNAVMLDYTARTDRETAVNFTNHTFFNLSGSERKDILSTQVTIFADAITEVDENLLPTGRLLPIAGTVFDFSKPKTLGQDFRSPQLQHTNGYDHNYVLAGTGYRKAAEAYLQATGRRILVFTDQPGMQLYTANGFSEKDTDRKGRPRKAHTGFCMETQHFPDSPNHPAFPSTILRPGERFTSRTVYKFEITEGMLHVG